MTFQTVSPLRTHMLTVGLTLTLTLGLTPACHRKDEGTGAPIVGGRGAHPWLIAGPQDREIVRGRIDREPYRTVYQELVVHADEDWQDRADPGVWDHSAHGHDAEVTFANAFLNWLEPDPARADRAREGFDRLQPDYETHTTFDIDIRMPHTLIGYTDAWDFLMAADALTDAESDQARDKLTEINRRFYEQFVEDDFYRGIWLGPAQNNHPIRTAAAIGYVALAFPEDPDADKWANWAIGELDYLWGPNGQYVQPDGGVSEGPFYYGFAWGVATALFIAAEHVVPEDRVFHENCINRQAVDPWTGHGCVDGEAFTFANPLRTESFQNTASWSVSLRLPDGSRPPLADAYFNPFNGGSILTSFGGGGYFVWDWENNVERPFETQHGIDLAAHHLVYLDDTVSPEEPPWLTRFLPDAGNAVFRSDWSPQARWLLLVAEHGSARKTLHDHADGTSFSMAAYGEYLLLDPGYYKPNSLDNAVTAQSDAHNVVLIDGQGAPPKGLLTNFGDADAWLENTLDGDRLDYAEARQSYQDTEVMRSVLMVDDRYFVVADRLMGGAVVDDRDYQWRLSGYAGYGSGGLFEPRVDGARWERTLAGVDVYLAATQPGLAVEEPVYVEGQRPHVHEFALDREVTDHGVIDGRLTGRDPGFLAVLAPYRVGDAPGSAAGPMAVTALDLGPGVAAWTVDSAGGTDVLILREPGPAAVYDVPGGSQITTDAELTLVRLDGTLGLIVRGSSASLDGTPVVSGAGAVSASP